MSQPIKPSECFPHVPDFVIDAVNTLLRRNLTATFAEFTCDELKNEIMEQGELQSIEQIKPSWLNIEDMYRQAGWIVVRNFDGIKFAKPE